MDAFAKLLQEWPAISSAPISFILAIVCAGAIVWAFMHWSYRARLANKDSQIELLDRQVSDYKNKLDGATPDEAKAKIEGLAEKVRNTIGSKWEPLSKSEVERLSAAVSPLKKRHIQVMYSNYLGMELAQSIADAFRQAGWNNVLFCEGGGLGTGVATGRGNGMAFTLKDVIEKTTRLKVRSSYPEEPDSGTHVFVSVGINPTDT